MAFRFSVGIRGSHYSIIEFRLNSRHNCMWVVLDLRRFVFGDAAEWWITIFIVRSAATLSGLSILCWANLQSNPFIQSITQLTKILSCRN